MNFSKTACAALLSILLFAPTAIASAQNTDPSTSSGQATTTMVSSWYRAKNSYDVANNRYPIGTIFLITNPVNGKIAIGEVAGTGPFIKGRDLDVSGTIAATLGFKAEGVATLDVEVLYMPA